MGHDFGEEFDVIAPKVDQFAGGVDLGLVNGFALAEHGGAVEDGAIGAGKQFGGFEKDGGAVFPWGVGPVGAGIEGGFDGEVDFFFTRFVIKAEFDGMVEWGGDVFYITRADFLATNDEGDFDGV